MCGVEGGAGCGGDFEVVAEWGIRRVGREAGASISFGISLTQLLLPLRQDGCDDEGSALWVVSALEQELSCACGANSEAGPKGGGQDARSKERPPPTWRLPRIGQLLLHCLNSGIHAVAMYWRKGADIPVDSRYVACRPRLTAAQGPG